MKRSVRSGMVVALALAMMTSAYAVPEYLEAYKKDPFRKSSMDGCVVCHNGPNGGSRNPFGQQLEGTGGSFSALLRASWPDRFAYPSYKIGDTAVLHFSDPANKQLVIETNGKKYVVDLEKQSVNGLPAEVPGQ